MEIMNEKRGERGKSLLKCRRSQITIFVIIALVIILIIVLFFAIKKTPLQSLIFQNDNPKNLIEKCAKDSLTNAEKDIIVHGGFSETSILSKNMGYSLLDNNKVIFMCYTPFQLQKCTNKHGALVTEISQEILNIIKPKIEKCFNDVKNQLSKYDYIEGNLDINVDIMPQQIMARINKSVVYTKNDQTVKIEEFNSKISSPLFDFISLGNDIINQELECDCENEACNADLNELNRLNRDFEITKPAFSGKGEEIYQIKEVLSDKEFNFAIRNCVAPIMK